jgi:hypothetical protein
MARENLKRCIFQVWYQVLAAVTMKMAVFWIVASCGLVRVSQGFRGLYCLRHQGDESPIALMMESVRTYETSVNIHQSTRRYNPEDGHLRCIFRLTDVTRTQQGPKHYLYYQAQARPRSVQTCIRPWRWRQHVCPERWCLLRSPHGTYVPDDQHGHTDVLFSRRRQMRCWAHTHPVLIHVMWAVYFICASRRYQRRPSVL